MKKYLFVFTLFVFLMPLFLLAQDPFKPGSEPIGFKGMLWGTPISAFSSMALKESYPGTVTLKKVYPEFDELGQSSSIFEKTYKSDTDVLKIEGVVLDEINYIFYKDTFSGVILLSRGHKVFEQLKNACFAKYGEAKMTGGSGNYFAGFHWQGSESQVVLLFAAGDIVTLYISSMKTKREIEKSRQDARSPLIEKIYWYAHLVWSADADAVGARNGGRDVYAFQERIDQYRDIEDVIGKHTKVEWQATCDASNTQTNDLEKRSDRAICNAAGALYFEDVFFCDALSYVKNFAHEPDLKTKCVTAVALKKKDKNICATQGIDNNLCNARFDKGSSIKKTFK